MVKNRLPNTLLYVSISQMILPVILQLILPDTHPPTLQHVYYTDWITYPAFYWLSNLLLISSLLCRVAQKQKLYNFTLVFLLFSVGAFWGFEIKGAIYPILLFVAFYYVLTTVAKKRAVPCSNKGTP